MQTILDAMTRSEIRRSLKDLSSDLSQVFENTMQRIRQGPRKLHEVAMKSLMWVSHARRPLLVIELCHALATRMGDTEFDEEAVLHPKIIVESCLGLVVIDEKSSTVRLVHYALQEYLHTRESISIHSQNEESEITKILLTYICLEDPSSRTVHGPDDDDQARAPNTLHVLCYSFLEYASRNWGHHAKLASANDIQVPALNFLRDAPKVERANQSMASVLHHTSDEVCRDFGVQVSNRSKRTGLHILAGFGLSELMLLLLDEGADVDAVDELGNTPLHAVAVSGSIEAARVLLYRSAEVDSTNFDYNTPLFVAVSFSHYDLALELLTRGANPNSQCVDCWSPLHKAADNDNISIARLLLDHGASVSSESARGLIPLHRAAGRGNLVMIDLLLTAGSPIESRTDDGWTPLHGASNSGQHKAVQVLLDHGADVNRQSTDGRTALNRACRRGHYSSVLALLTKKADRLQQDESGNIPLHRAAKGGHFSVADLLLAQDPSSAASQLTWLNAHQKTAREEASNSGHWDLAASLRRRQSELAGSTTESSSDLDIAISTRDIPLVRELVAQGLDINQRNQDGFAPLHLAILSENIIIATMLVNHMTADIDVKTADGWTPLHCAAKTGKEELVRLCLERGGDISTCTMDGQTVLHKACKSGCVEPVSLLLERGADAEAQDHWGWRPLHTASATGSKAIVETLLSNGVDIWARDKEHRTAILCAAGAGHYGLVEYLRLQMIDKEGTLKYPDQLQTVLRTGIGDYDAHTA